MGVACAPRPLPSDRVSELRTPDREGRDKKKARARGLCGLNLETAQRCAVTMSPWKAEEAPPEAGTCRGSDMAAAATIVTNSTRRVHMSASIPKIPSPQR